MSCVCACLKFFDIYIVGTLTIEIVRSEGCVLQMKLLFKPVTYVLACVILIHTHIVQASPKGYYRVLCISKDIVDNCYGIAWKICRSTAAGKRAINTQMCNNFNHTAAWPAWLVLVRIQCFTQSSTQSNMTSLTYVIESLCSWDVVYSVATVIKGKQLHTSIIVNVIGIERSCWCFECDLQ